MAYERALAASVAWRGGVDAPLSRALNEAPTFVMAHVLKAYQVLSGRDPRRVRTARLALTNTADLPANARERLHLATIAALLDDDYDSAKRRLGDVLRAHPLDVLALQMAHAFDYVTGDLVRKNGRIALVLPAWSSDVPGYHAVLSMHAFCLEECGEFGLAESMAREALAANPFDARAHHVVAHVFEMTGRPAEGVRWMDEHRVRWSIETVVANHCWWHLALFHLGLGHVDAALAMYDEHLAVDADSEIADLIDASALLWRLHLRGIDTGARWAALAAVWSPHIDDAFCSFSDLHAMLSFVGARDWDRAHRLERSLADAHARHTRYGATTRQLGLPAGRALIAFGRGDDARAIHLLGNLPAVAYRLGGSHAQRDVLHLTMLQAIERIRRPGRTVGRRVPGALPRIDLVGRERRETRASIG